MKKLFKAIRNNDLFEVKEIITKKPELVNCVAKQPPKKDDGQSPLQVALKTGNFEIAKYLIDMGADLNFIEDDACCNEWRMPVVHDAITAAVMCSRWNVNNSYMGFQVYSTKERADRAFDTLCLMIDKGADVNGLDSYGNSGIWRFCLQSNQVLPSFNYVDRVESDDRLFTDEVHEDLRRILEALKEAGADPFYAAPNFGKCPLDFYTEGSLSIILKEVFKDRYKKPG